MTRCIELQFPDTQTLQSVARGVGLNTGLDPDVTAATQDSIDSFFQETLCYFGEAVAFLRNDANLLRATMHDSNVFERSIRVIENPYQKYLLHAIVCKFYEAPLPSREGEGLFAKSKIVNSLKQKAPKKIKPVYPKERDS